jgi:two-component system CheB/CheR fusion protein
VGRPISDFHADPRVAEDMLERLARGETLDSHEATLRARDGSLRFVLVSANVLWEAGRFVHARCFTRDISHLKQAQRAVEEADRRKAAILNASLDAILTMDAEGRLVDFNSAAERIFGYRREEAIGHPLAELIIPPALRQAHADGLRRYLATGQGRVIGRRIEITALHALGHEFPVELSIAAVEGAKPLFTATLRDISDRKAHEAALLEADRRKDEFIATLAHELRNPLAPMRNAATLLTMAGLPLERQQWAIGVISRQIRHMARLLDDLLDAARITRGKLVLQKQAVRLQEVVRSAVEVVQPLIDERLQALEVRVPPEEVSFEADPVRIAQVLSNLLVNASKYSDPGTPIRLQAGRQDGFVVIEVADCGIGLAADELGELFTLFKQLPAGGGASESGLGVGLALSRALVELHGGTLVARSAGRGQGSSFTVSLPAGEGSAGH